MEPLNIEEFNPKKAELVAMVDGFKDLTIGGIDDTIGYKKVHDARMKLVHARGEITRFGKSLREKVDMFRKEVLEKEKDYVSIIAPVEKDLESKEVAIDMEKERVKRQAKIPGRRGLLNSIEYNQFVTDDQLLDMNDVQFQDFLSNKTRGYLEDKARKIKEREDALEAEKKKIQDEKDEEERKKNREEDLEKARSDAIKKAEKDAGEALVAAVEEERQRGERERQRIIEDNARKESERAAAEAKKKLNEEYAVAKEKEEALKLEKKKKYQKFLADNGYTEENKEEFYIHRIQTLSENKVILFKKVGEITI